MVSLVNAIRDENSHRQRAVWRTIIVIIVIIYSWRCKKKFVRQQIIRRRSLCQSHAPSGGRGAAGGENRCARASMARRREECEREKELLRGLNRAYILSGGEGDGGLVYCFYDRRRVRVWCRPYSGRRKTRGKKNINKYKTITPRRRPFRRRRYAGQHRRFFRLRIHGSLCERPPKLSSPTPGRLWNGHKMRFVIIYSVSHPIAP